MIHQFVKGSQDQTLIMLHGTGGNEFDLIPIAQLIDPKANILSPRGNVNEHGMPRFFKRLGFGIFDMESLAIETKNLHDFIMTQAKQYGFKLEKTTIIGYSNGANILANLLLEYELPIARAVMMHPMVPKSEHQIITSPKTQCLLTVGNRDQMIDPKEGIKLAHLLKSLNYNVEVLELDQGHEVTRNEINLIKSWYEKEPR